MSYLALNSDWLRPTGLIFNNTANFGHPVGVIDDAIVYPEPTGQLDNNNFDVSPSDDEKYVIYSVQKPTSTLNNTTFDIYSLFTTYRSAFGGALTGLYMWANYTLDGLNWHEPKAQIIPYYYAGLLNEPSGREWFRWSWPETSAYTAYTNPQIMFSGGGIPGVANPMAEMEAAFVQLDGQGPPLYIEGGDPAVHLAFHNNFNSQIIRPSSCDFYQDERNLGTYENGKNIVGYIDENVYYPFSTGNLYPNSITDYGYSIPIIKGFIEDRRLIFPSSTHVGTFTNMNVALFVRLNAQTHLTTDTTLSYYMQFTPDGSNYNADHQWFGSLTLPSSLTHSDYVDGRWIYETASAFYNPRLFTSPRLYLNFDTSALPGTVSIGNRVIEIRAAYIELETETHFPLYILGDPTGTINDNVPMYIPNITTLVSGAPLWIYGANLNNSGVPLYTFGVAGGTTGNIPIYMNAIGALNEGRPLYLQNVVPSSTINVPLYITTSETGSGSVFSINDGINLFVNQSGYSTQQNITSLYLQGATLGYSTEGATLYLKNDTTNQNSLALSICNNYSGVYNSVGLYVQQVRDDGPSVFDPYYFELEDGGIPIREGRPLFINAGFGGGIPFYLAVNSQSSGGAPFFIQGANLGNSGITLVMPNTNAALTKGLPLYGHGF